jgi:ubiquinone biosynthesis monooxygenase Coq7
MQERHLTHLDRLLAGANNALRTIAAPAGHATRKNPAGDVAETDLSEKQKTHAAGLMRVNHAGEVAAQALYQGHAMVARDPAIEQQMQRAANEEFDHLAWCEQRLTELGSRPSLLSPGFIAETEKQVCAHLDSHLDNLPDNDDKSRAIVKQMRDEEEEHGENAIEAGAAELPAPLQRLMKLTAKVMTNTAYRL